MRSHEKKSSQAAGLIFIGLTGLLAACIVVQTFFAGLAIFNDSAHWRSHAGFVHLFEFVPILMLITAFVGRLPNYFRWQSSVLFLLIFIQYFTANFPGAGAVHPVIAIVLFWLSITVLKRALQWRAEGMRGNIK